MSETAEKLKWKVGDDWQEFDNVDLGNGLTLKTILEQTAAKSQSDAEKQIKEFESKTQQQIQEIRNALGSKDNALSEAEKKIKEFELANMSAEEKAKKMFDDQIAAANQDLEKAKEEANHYRQLYTDDKVKNDLLTAIGSLGQDMQVHNPDQVVRLLRTEGVTQLVEKDGLNHTIVKLNVEGVPRELSPKEAIEHYLKLPSNANLLKSTLAAGAGSSSSGGTGSGSKQRVTKSEWTRMVSGAENDAARRKLILEKEAGKYEVLPDEA